MIENLYLQNPGFEGLSRPGGWTRVTHSGQPYGEIFTPEGWVTWWEEGIYRRPEVKVIPGQAPFLDPPRIYQGEWAVQMFTYYGRMHAGLYQVITGLTPGETYEFSIQAHAWSTTPGLEGEHDAHCSAGVGCGPVYILPENVPPLNGSPPNDAIGNFKFQVGVSLGDEPDPFGEITWCDGACIYNGYHEVPPVRFTAPQDGKVVVYVRAMSLWQFRNSDIYLDNAVLMTAESKPSPPERGQPRVQYARTYGLLPPGAGKEWVLAFIDATWDERRLTLGGSADDAGLGDLDERNVIAVNPGEWPGDLLDFYKGHYPGVSVQTIEAATPTILKQILSDDHSDIACCQRDTRWADLDLGEDPGGETIGEAGCCLCCYVMALRHAGHWVNPPELNRILADSGEPFVDDDMLVDWAAAVCLFPKVFDRAKKDNTQYSAAGLRALLDTGWEIILRRGDGARFVYLERVESNALRIVDPWDGQRKVWTQNMAQGIRAARRGQVSEPVPEFTLRGVHDVAGGDWLLSEGLEGWCTVASYMNIHPRRLGLERFADVGIRTVVNLRYSWAKDDGGLGTMPGPDRLEQFERACVETMQLNPDVWAFAYCNEMNNLREWPNNYDLTPAYYRDSFNRVYLQKPTGVRLLVGAIDPTNPGWGDWRVTWGKVLNEIAECDGYALHAYTHGSTLGLIWHDKRFSNEPLIGVHYDLRMLEDQQAVIPSRYAHLPQIATESNHLTRLDGKWGWDPDTGDWVREAYRYFAEARVQGATLFRYDHTGWSFKDIPAVLQALRELT